MLLRQTEGIGPLDAKIMIIGEALGADERLKGEPFIGWSGQFLREMCERAGLSWTSLRVDNIVQYQPPANDFKGFYNDKAQREPTEELRQWWDDLYSRINIVKPKVIIAAGDQPLYALIGHRGSTSWRGSVVQSTIGDHTCFVIPIVHPSYSRRCYNMTSSKMKDMRQPWFHVSVFDLMKAKKVADEGWTPKVRTDKIFPTYLEVMEYLEELDSMPSDTSITLDIETLRREYVKCIGLTHRDDYAMCIPFVANTSGQSYYPLSQEAEIWRKLDAVLNSHYVNGQTIGFDCSYLDRDIGLWFTDNIYIDTAILHSLLYPELKHDLGFLASMYTDMSYFKYLGRGSEVKTNIADTVDFLNERVAKGDQELAVIGFSLGAYYALELSATDPDHIRAVVVFYGTRDGDYHSSRATYLGHFAEQDEFEPQSNVDNLEAALRRASRPVSFYRYIGTGHWFFEPDRSQAYNQAAANLAWERTLTFLRNSLPFDSK